MPDRIRLSRAPGWRLPEGSKTVARPGKWGNPFAVRRVPGSRVVARDGRAAHRWVVSTGGETIATTRDPVEAALIAVQCHRDWIVRGDVHGSWPAGLAVLRDRVIDHLPELSGYNLGCWCSLDHPCHADTLLAMANGGEW